MKKVMAAALMCVGLVGGAANAAQISFGALSSNSDGSTEIIKDTLNNRDWLRLDVLADLTYAQTVAATSAGGAYEAFSIAGIQEAQDFTDALLDQRANSCSTAPGEDVVCDRFLNVDLGAMLGENYSILSGYSYGMFRSDDNLGQEVGLLRMNSRNPASGEVRKLNDWTSFAGTDTYSTVLGRTDISISWLVYRDHVAVVPVPAALPLMLAGIGALGLVKRRRRKQADA